jgi:hypothetical protein
MVLECNYDAKMYLCRETLAKNLLALMCVRARMSVCACMNVRLYVANEYRCENKQKKPKEITSLAVKLCIARKKPRARS